MSRSGYSDDYDEPGLLNCWRGAVKRAAKGRRGQRLMRDIVRALDALQERRLIAGELVSSDGCVCALGAVAKLRGVDVTGLDPEDRDAVAEAFDIAPALAAEVVFVNDEWVYSYSDNESAQERRWQVVRQWAERIANGGEP